MREREQNPGLSITNKGGKRLRAFILPLGSLAVVACSTPDIPQPTLTPAIIRPQSTPTSIPATPEFRPFRVIDKDVRTFAEAIRLLNSAFNPDFAQANPIRPRAESTDQSGYIRDIDGDGRPNSAQYYFWCGDKIGFGGLVRISYNGAKTSADRSITDVRIDLGTDAIFLQISPAGPDSSRFYNKNTFPIPSSLMQGAEFKEDPASREQVARMLFNLPKEMAFSQEDSRRGPVLLGHYQNPDGSRIIVEVVWRDVTYSWHSGD